MQDDAPLDSAFYEIIMDSGAVHKVRLNSADAAKLFNAASEENPKGVVEIMVRTIGAEGGKALLLKKSAIESVRHL